MESDPTSAPLRIGLIGDHDPDVRAHVAIPPALVGAGQRLGATVESVWLATDSIDRSAPRLAGFDGLWCVPASPYRSMEGALAAIRFARDQGIPFLGTCGGFQHVLIEYARNALGIAEADHAETNPDAGFVLIAALACSLVGSSGPIVMAPGSRAAIAYGRLRSIERYHCSYGLNPEHRARLDDGRLHETGWDEGGDVRIVELAGDGFHVATLFQPELTSTEGAPHPLIVAFVRAVAGHAERAAGDRARSQSGAAP